MTDEHDDIRRAAREIGECPRRLVAYYERHVRSLNVTPDAFALSLRALFSGRVIITTIGGSDARTRGYARRPER